MPLSVHHEAAAVNVNVAPRQQRSNANFIWHQKEGILRTRVGNRARAHLQIELLVNAQGRVEDVVQYEEPAEKDNAKSKALVWHYSASNVRRSGKGAATREERLPKDHIGGMQNIASDDERCLTSENVGYRSESPNERHRFKWDLLACLSPCFLQH